MASICFLFFSSLTDSAISSVPNSDSLKEIRKLEEGISKDCKTNDYYVQTLLRKRIILVRIFCKWDEIVETVP